MDQLELDLVSESEHVVKLLQVWEGLFVLFGCRMCDETFHLQPVALSAHTQMEIVAEHLVELLQVLFELSEVFLKRIFLAPSEPQRKEKEQIRVGAEF